MYGEHLSDEDIKKFVTFEGPLKSEEGEKWIKFSQEVNAHIADCKECRGRVRKAQELYDALGTISEELGIPREEGISMFDKIPDDLVGLMHDDGHTYSGHSEEYLKAAREEKRAMAEVRAQGVPKDGIRAHAEEPADGLEVDARKHIIGQKEYEEITPKKIIETQEAYDLAPAETKKGGLISYVKGLVEKIKGMFGR